jgi:hypothetical protein
MKVCSVKDGESNFLAMVRCRVSNYCGRLTGEGWHNISELHPRLRLLVAMHTELECCMKSWHICTSNSTEFWDIFEAARSPS